MGGAGRPKGSDTGHTVEVKSVSMTPESWRLLDELGGNNPVPRAVSIALADVARILARCSGLLINDFFDGRLRAYDRPAD